MFWVSGNNVEVFFLRMQVMVMQEGSTSLFGQHLKLPSLPSSSLNLTFPDAKKSKSSHGSKVSKGSFGVTAGRS